MAEASSSLAGDKGKRKVEGLDDLMVRLDLKEEDFDDISFDDFEEEITEGTRWMAIASVYLAKPYSHAAFYSSMKYAWGLAQDVRFRAIGDNLYVVQVFCLGDWERIMEEGPWLFRGCLVLMEPYDGISKPSSITLDRWDVWIQIHDLPEGYRKEKLLKMMVQRMGEVVYMESEQTDAVGNFVRIRMRFSASKPLVRFVSVVRNKKREIFRVCYEKLPRFCGVCGSIGHVVKECGTGIHDPKKIVYGAELLADQSWRARDRMGAGRGGVRGRRGGRSGPGRGGMHDGGRGQKDHFEEEGEEDGTMDTASRPVKPPSHLSKEVVMIDKEKSARKRLAIEGAQEMTTTAVVATQEEAGVDPSRTERNIDQIPPPPPSALEQKQKRIGKRQKGDNSLVSATSDTSSHVSDESADSHGEYRREQ